MGGQEPLVTCGSGRPELQVEADQLAVVLFGRPRIDPVPDLVTAADHSDDGVGLAVLGEHDPVAGEEFFAGEDGVPVVAL